MGKTDFTLVQQSLICSSAVKICPMFLFINQSCRVIFETIKNEKEKIRPFGGGCNFTKINVITSLDVDCHNIILQVYFKVCAIKGDKYCIKDKLVLLWHFYMGNR